MWKFWQHKRVQGIGLFVLARILQVNGVIDEHTAQTIETLGGGLAAVGVVHAQEKAKAKP